MKRRELLVFAGQSNMMGACACAPAQEVHIRDSWEYLHKGVQLGEEKGRFRRADFPCGEFAYCDLNRAYPDGADFDTLSDLADYRANTYFVPSMCNRKADDTLETEPFAVYSERSFTPGPALPPYLAQEWEALGHTCAYAHIAKGAVSILHYFDDEMLAEYHVWLEQKHPGHSFPRRTINDMCRGASACFAHKCRDFFRDCRERFAQEELGSRCLIWLQGESDAMMSQTEYQTLLEVLWLRARNIGFTHFFCLRVGFFGNENILQVMKAQEQFCQNAPNAWMLTRASSLIPFAGHRGDWFLHQPGSEYQNCRDSFLGFANQHINEKGFRLIAARAAGNMERILHNNEPPLLEAENIRGMLE